MRYNSKKSLSDSEGAMLRFASLMCSRICHDVIGPLGAINNGFELLEDESDHDSRRHIQTVMRNSTDNAIAKINLERIAMGISGSSDSDISLDSMRDLCEGYFGADGKSIVFKSEFDYFDKLRFRVLLNTLMIIPSFAPRCTDIGVHISGSSADCRFRISTRSSYARLDEKIISLLERRAVIDELNPRNIHPFYTGLLASHCGLRILVRRQRDAIYAIIE